LHLEEKQEPVADESAPAPDATTEDVNWLALDDAIALSILSTSPSLSAKLAGTLPPVDQDGNEIPMTLSAAEETRLKKLASSILLVGGGLSGVQGADRMLEER
jgi:hypothetical protein